MKAMMDQDDNAEGRILIVDDSEQHRTAIAGEVSKLGYDVQVAPSGARALQLVSTEEYDLVLLDVVMPGLDGFGTLRQIRSKYKQQELPVIMLTARGAADDVIQALRLGANDYAVKPILTDELQSRMSSHIKLKKTLNQRLGNYILREKLGEGAMGVVYSAEHTETGALVAVKVLPRAFTHQKSAIHRFRQEAFLTSRIEHPNVVALYEIGKEDEIFFIAMELVDGPALDKLCNEKPIEPLENVLYIGQQIAAGLQALAHEKIIHRDIKPHNVMLNSKGVAKIADFGIALDTNRDNRLTNEGSGLGSLVYASIEQIIGKPDLRSDIYSLGCTLFELSSGHLPFPADRDIEWMLKAKQGRAPKLRKAAPHVPEPLAKLIADMMAPKAQDRPQNYQELFARFDSIGHALGWTRTMEQPS